MAEQILTHSQLSEFHQRGYVVLNNAVQHSEIADMQRRLWSLLSKHGITQDRESWPTGDVSRLQAIRDGDSDPAQSRTLPAALDQIFGANAWLPHTHWGQALVTFPVPGRWRPNAGPWHLDHSYLQQGQISGVNVFLFVQDVSEQAGGTLVLESSPALVTRYLENHPEHMALKHSALNKLIMNCDPWLQTLATTSRAADEIRLHSMNVLNTALDTPITLTELTGYAGDLVICHPLLLHAPSMNTSQQPRMMRVQRFYRRTAE